MSSIRRHRGVAFSVVLCLAVPALAKVRIFEPQAAGCGTWTTQRTTHDPALHTTEAWVIGFVSGLAAGNPKADLLANLDAKGVLDGMDRYCNDNPGADLADAAEHVVKPGKKHPQ